MSEYVWWLVGVCVNVLVCVCMCIRGKIMVLRVEGLGSVRVES